MTTSIQSFVLVLTLVFARGVFADCPQFETALEKAIARVMARETARETARKEVSVGGAAGAGKPVLTAVKTPPKAGDWSVPEAQTYKVRYGKETVGDTGNRSFINLMEQDQKIKRADVVYFDVENAVQKKLNDTLIGDKGMVDAVNNSFMEKFAKNLKESPDLMARLEGQYKDYKSLRLRLTLKPGDNAADLQAKLNALYQKTNAEFVAEFEKGGLNKLLPPRTDGSSDVSTWFLSGTGDSALEANMAARGARGAGFGAGKAKTLSFKQQVESMHADVTTIENLRKGLANSSELLSAGIMIKTADGAVIPSKDMIGVLRKIKPSDCATPAEYAAKIRAKVKTLFNTDISDAHISELSEYFAKVDSISPPLFQRERVAINLGEAKSGIVSVDFTGVGVDNAYEQMRALSSVNYGQTDKVAFLKDAFSRVQGNVDNVTADMNKAKRSFTLASRDPNDPGLVPRFSGDDGILMPKTNWATTDKQNLLRQLAKTEDPSKYRITFVKTEYANGAVIPAGTRSAKVVRAETIEKNVREAITGQAKIPSERAKRMIIAIDSIPQPQGGKFNLILGGDKPTPEEKQLIIDAFRKTLGAKEEFGELIEAF